MVYLEYIIEKDLQNSTWWQMTMALIFFSIQALSCMYVSILYIHMYSKRGMLCSIRFQAKSHYACLHASTHLLQPPKKHFFLRSEKKCSVICYIFQGLITFEKKSRQYHICALGYIGIGTWTYYIYFTMKKVR